MPHIRPSVDDGSQRELTSNVVTDGRHIFSVPFWAPRSAVPSLHVVSDIGHLSAPCMMVALAGIVLIARPLPAMSTIAPSRPSTSGSSAPDRSKGAPPCCRTAPPTQPLDLFGHRLGCRPAQADVPFAPSFTPGNPIVSAASLGFLAFLGAIGQEQEVQTLCAAQPE